MTEFIEGKVRQSMTVEQWPHVRGDRLVNLQLVEADKTNGFRGGLPQLGPGDENMKRTLILYDDQFKVEERKNL